MSTLSICTIAQDEEEPIRWYLEACLYTSQVLQKDLKEIVVVDGGSKDKTLQVLKEYESKMPLIVLERPFDTTREQQNFALDHCTGDFVFTPDADMTWTSNFPFIFMAGMFDNAPFWDFPMLFTGKDAYHYFHRWPQGVNMRLHRRGPRWHRQFHVQLEGQTGGLPVCSDVVIFENSCRIKNDEALMWRGQRRQIYDAAMAAEGAAPGPADRFYGAAHAPESEFAPIPQWIAQLILPSTNG